MTEIEATAEIGTRRPLGREPDVRVVIARGRVLLLVGVGYLEIVGEFERAGAQRQRVADAPPCPSVQIEKTRRAAFRADGIEHEVEVAAPARDEPVSAAIRK